MASGSSSVGRQRADDHRVGSGLEAADVQGGGCARQQSRVTVMVRRQPHRRGRHRDRAAEGRGMKIGMAIRQLQRCRARLRRANISIGQRHAATRMSITPLRRCRCSAVNTPPGLTEWRPTYDADVIPTDERRRLDGIYTGTSPPDRSCHCAPRGSRRASCCSAICVSCYLQACEISILWVELGQAAQALRDAALLTAVTEMHNQTVIQMKWTTTRLKETAPIVLVAG